MYSEKDIAEKFPLPERFLEDPGKRVLWERSKAILCGEGERVSKESFEYTERFVAALTENETLVENQEEYERRISRLREGKNEELTEGIKRRLVIGAPDDLLQKQRAFFGISKEEDQIPFEVVVVSSPPEAHTRAEKQAAWVESAEVPTLFMTRDEKKGETPTIYVPDFEAELILQGSALNAKGYFEHEYRHTQRRFSYGNDRLFRFIDEVATNVQGYNKQMGLLNMMSWTTDSLSYRAFKSAYESGDKQQKAELLNQFAEAFGNEGLVALGGKRSSEHSGDNDGLEGSPRPVSPKFNENGDAAFAELMFSLRAKKDPNFQETFRKRIGHEDVTLPQLQIVLGYQIGAYKKDIPEGQPMILNELIDIVEAEIMRRKINGEKELFANLPKPEKKAA
jgi:hypothetical protein